MFGQIPCFFCNLFSSCLVFGDFVLCVQLKRRLSKKLGRRSRAKDTFGRAIENRTQSSYMATTRIELNLTRMLRDQVSIDVSTLPLLCDLFAVLSVAAQGLITAVPLATQALKRKEATKRTQRLATAQVPARKMRSVVLHPRCTCDVKLCLT